MDLQPSFSKLREVTRWELEDSFEQSVRIRNPQKREVVGDPFRAKSWRGEDLEESFDLRSEIERSVNLRVVQRLDAESIASEEELVPLRIPDREGEDAVQPLQHRPAVLAVGREQHFRIALGTEAGPVALEICTELLEVVELAVVDDPVPSVRVRHRLSSTFGQVDDREPPVTQRGCRAAVSCRKAAKAFAVWPAMLDGV